MAGASTQQLGCQGQKDFSHLHLDFRFWLAAAVLREMAALKTDRELLTQFAAHGSESAFQELVQRHVDVVFATALRGLSDAGAAEEITQNVFITLARKAAWLRGETSVIGWLHKTALFEVRCWWRGELRRQRREKTAVE